MARPACPNRVGVQTPRRFTHNIFYQVAERGCRRQTHLKRGVLKLKNMKTKKTEKQKKPTTFLVPPGRFSPEVKTAAKTPLKPYVLKLKKETPENQITAVKTQNKKRFVNVVA